jgi:hypothetical protein
MMAMGATAAAQTGGPVADREFTGAIAVSGGFTADFDEEGVSGAVTVVVDGHGPLELTLAAGHDSAILGAHDVVVAGDSSSDDSADEAMLEAISMTGTWSLSGTQTSGGSFSGSAAGATASIIISGDGVFDGGGQMGGPPAGYRLTGSITTTNTANFDVAGIASQSATSTETDQLDSLLTDVIVLCQDIYGRWDLQIRQAIQDVGFDEFIRGYFTASTGVDATEQAEAVEELLAEVARWAGDASSTGSEPGERGLYIGRALSLLDRSQRLQAELSADSPCPPDPTFATELTLAAQDVLNTLIDRFPHITNTTLVAFGLGTGAIGAGSATSEVAAALQAEMEADVNSKFDEFFADWPDGTSDADLIEVARTGQALGMETLGSSPLSPTDIILVLTGENE